MNDGGQQPDIRMLFREFQHVPEAIRLQFDIVVQEPDPVCAMLQRMADSDVIPSGPAQVAARLEQAGRWIMGLQPFWRPVGRGIVHHAHSQAGMILCQQRLEAGIQIIGPVVMQDNGGDSGHAYLPPRQGIK